jgi:8-hydroxy-5-deazaflavin:NADPH oxidoreductase
VTGVGIVGAGRLGQAIARVATRAGRSVVIANSRGPESLAPEVAALAQNVFAGTVTRLRCLVLDNVKYLSRRSARI